MPRLPGYTLAWVAYGAGSVCAVIAGGLTGGAARAFSTAAVMLLLLAALLAITS